MHFFFIYLQSTVVGQPGHHGRNALARASRMPAVAAVKRGRDCATTRLL